MAALRHLLYLLCDNEALNMHHCAPRVATIIRDAAADLAMVSLFPIDATMPRKRKALKPGSSSAKPSKKSKIIRSLYTDLDGVVSKACYATHPIIQAEMKAAHPAKIQKERTAMSRAKWDAMTMDAKISETCVGSLEIGG